MPILKYSEPTAANRRLYFIVGLLLLSVPAYGVDFETLVGETIPSINAHKFKSYFKDQVIPARLAECVDVVRPTTYYVDYSAGSDANNGTAPTTPKKTIAAGGASTDVNELVAASSGYITVLFKCGTTHYTDTPLTISGKDGVKIGSYVGTDLVYTQPVISLFSQDATGSWTSSSDSGSTNDGVSTYYRTLAAEPGWIIENTNELTRLTPFRYRNSLANLQATSRSWWWDDPNDRLYIHYSADPASIAFKYSLESHADNSGAIEITDADLTLIENIQVDGNGCTAITNQSSGYGIVGTSSIDRLVVRDCKVFYGGNHCFGSFGGGQVLFQRCVGGYCSNTTGSTTFVFFDDTFASTDECIFDECVCFAGHAPNNGDAPGIDSSHTGFYCHHGTSGNLGLIATIDCSEPPPINVTNATATYGNTVFTDLPGDDSQSSIRAFWISHSINRPISRLYHLTQPKQAYLGCLWRAALNVGDTGNFIDGTSSTGGTFLNCIFDIVDYRTPTLTDVFYSTGAKHWNSSVHLNGTGSSQWRLQSSATPTPRYDDCLITRNGSRQITNNGNNGDTMFGNLAGYYLNQGTDSAGFGLVSGHVRLASPLSAGQSPIGTLAETGASSDGPRWDYYWRLRPDTGGSLGAVEANPDVMTETIYQYLQDGVKLRRVTP